MKKKFKLLVIMFAFAMQSTTIWAAASTGNKVTLHYNPGALLGNNPKPSRAPAKFSIPLTVLLDVDCHQLKVTSQVAGEYTYYIYNESGELSSQGILNCGSNECNTIDVDPCLIGSNTIVFIHNGIAFVGTFEI